jgi:TolA-binding protein
MGEARLGQGRLDDAITIGKRALQEKARPGRDLYILLGKAYIKKGNCKDAKTYCSKVLSGSNSNDPAALECLKLCEGKK